MIIGIMVVILIILTLIAGLIRISRIKSSKTIEPEGNILGKALIVYDPGLTGGTKTAGFNIADELKSKGYEVKLVGVKSQESLELAGYDILIIGSPTYGGKPTDPVESYLNDLKPTENIIAGVYTLAGGSAENSKVIITQILKEKSVPVKVSANYDRSGTSAPSDKNLYSQFVSELLE